MQLYEAHHQDLSRFCSSLIWDKDKAKDVMSETILRAYQNFEKVESAEKFKSYLFAIAANVHREYKRKYPNAVELDAESSSTIEMKFGEQHAIQKILALLPPKQAEVFTMYEVLDQSLETIADTLDTNISTVKTRLRRARQQLEKILSSEFKQHITHF